MQQRLASRNAKIVALYQSGKTARELAKRFGISFQRIEVIVDVAVGDAKRERKIGATSLPRVIVPDELAQAILLGKISLRCVAAKLNCSRTTIAARYPNRQKVITDVMKRRKAVYEEYMSGLPVSDLASKYGTSEGSIRQMIFKHTRRTGSPVKCPWLKRKKS